jgi:hypothetical protein
MYKFTYRDEFGEVTHRTVDFQDAKPGKSGNFLYLSGYCQLRNEWRTFRTDRMIGDIVNMDTGEILQIGASLRAPANDPYCQAPVHQAKKTAGQKGFGAFLLVVIAMILAAIA